MKDKFAPIKTIHFALCTGAALVYFLLGEVYKLDFLDLPEIDTTTLIYLIVPFSALFASNFMYKNILRKVDPKLPMESRIGTYQTAVIVRLAILEGAAFAILFLKKELLVIGLFLVIYMAFLRPSEDAMKRDFHLVGK
ncbi:MAG: MFS transporter [Bacteroidota bacterium]